MNKLRAAALTLICSFMVLPLMSCGTDTSDTSGETPPPAVSADDESPAAAPTEESTPQSTQQTNRTEAPERDPYKELNTYLNPEPSSVMDRERITYARQLFNKLPGVDKNNEAGTEVSERLLKAEALIWALDVEEMYAVFNTVGPDKNGGFAPSGGLWVWDSSWYALSDEQKALPEVTTARAHFTEVAAYGWETFSAIQHREYADAKAAEKIINDMDPSVPEDVTTARVAYDSLSEGAKAHLLNYEVLKKAEGVNDIIPRNLTAAGGRAWRQGDGITPEQYGQISARNKGWFPDARTEFIWIAGMLSSTGITVNVDYNTIAEDGKYTPDAEKYPAMTLAEWRKRHIDFAPQGGNVATHEEYLNYFDENDIYVYLQVESGFADMETLIDIYYDVFNIAEHKCVLGFAVDVEWYFGVETDQGIPVSDGRAKEWAEYLYDTWGQGKAALVLKHYNATHLPLTYRGGEEGESEKLIFCNDSQNLASWDGSVGAIWDSDTTQGGAASGMGRAFKLWADFYPDNKILYQIGYSGDMQWIYPMDGDIVRTMGIKLAEAASASPEQEIAVAWVNFTYNDPLTFGDITSPSVASKAGQISGMLASLSDLPGQRFDGARTAENGGTGATYTDAMLVARLRELVDSLPDGEAGPNELTGGSLSLWNERVTRLKELEPMALDIRIDTVLSSGELKPSRDMERVTALFEAYIRFDDTQKAAVVKADELIAAAEMLGIFIR